MGRKKLRGAAPCNVPTSKSWPPSRSYESLAAAIQAGADAVYFGVGKLNMRSASAANFSLDDLARIVATAHHAGVKAYLTVNTVVYEDEIAEVHAVIDRAKEEGVDAMIATDMAAILYARRIGQEVHISTQSNISNSEAVRFYAQWADTVVLARELSLEQVAAIHRRIVENDIRGPRGELVEIEMFAHGALCMSISGKCYLSLHETGCSANRGACRQLCRRKYTLRDKDTGAAARHRRTVCPRRKDLCTIDFLDRMVGAGVRVLKIEDAPAARSMSSASSRLRRGAARPRRRALHARAGRIAQGAPPHGLQPRILGGILRRAADGRAQPRLRLVGHAPQGLRGKGYELLPQDLGRRSARRGGAAVRRRGDLLPGPDHGRRRAALNELHGPDGNLTQQVLQGQFCAIRTPGIVRRGDQLCKFVEATPQNTQTE